MAIINNLESMVVTSSRFAVLTALLSTTLILYVLVLGFYRLFLSPLAKFPGPKLAALTQWVETYYELFKGDGGQFAFEYAKWHEKYGESSVIFNFPTKQDVYIFWEKAPSFASAPPSSIFKIASFTSISIRLLDLRTSSSASSTDSTIRLLRLRLASTVSIVNDAGL